MFVSRSLCQMQSVMPHGKMNQEVETWNDLCMAETEVMADSEILLDENMRRTKRAGVWIPQNRWKDWADFNRKEQKIQFLVSFLQLKTP